MLLKMQLKSLPTNQKLHRNSANARNRKWYAINPNAKAKKTAWAKAHPEVGVAKTVRYLTAKKHQYPAWADHKAIKMMYRAAQVFRVSGFDVQVDHIIPLQGKTVRGFHVHNNLQIITAKRNQMKSNRFNQGELT